LTADCGSNGTSTTVSGPEFQTACATVSSFPYIYSFEDATVNDNADWTSTCWSADPSNTSTQYRWNPNENGTPSSYTGPSAAYDGTKYAYTEASNGSSGDIALLISPVFDMTSLTHPRVSFYYHMYGSGMGTLALEAYDGTDWTEVWSISGQQQDSSDAAWKQGKAYVPTNTVKIRFKGIRGSSYAGDMAVDYIVIEDVDCPEPTRLYVTDITWDQATLHWTDNSGGTETFLVEWREEGTTIWNSHTTAAGETSYTLTGLNPNTRYEWQVTAQCGGGATSTTEVGPNFTTDCTPIASFPWTEDFEDTSPTRDCWKNDHVIGNADWTIDTGAGVGNITNAHSGTKNARYISQSDVTATLFITPPLDLSGLNYPIVGFWYGQEKRGSYFNYLYIYYSSNNGDSWHLLKKFKEEAPDWTYYELHLPEPSATYRIGFLGINLYGYPNVLDDVTVFEGCEGGTTVWNGTGWDNGMPANDKFAVLSGDYFTELDGAIDACALKITSGNTLYIGGGNPVQLKYNLINEEEIYIENGNHLVQTDEFASVEGEAIYTLEVISDPVNSQYDDIFWSSPLASDSLTLGDILADAWGYFTFNPATQQWEWASTSTIMEPGKGYVVSAPRGTASPTTVTVEFSKDFDPFNAGTIKVPVIINGTGAQDNDDYNFLGNPYPSALDFDQFVADNPILQGSYWIWTNCENNDYHSTAGYAVYNATGGTSACGGTGPAAGQYIAAGQGFIVEANTAGDVLFKNTQRATAAADFLNRPARNRVTDRLWLEVYDGQGFYKQLLIGFSDQATDTVDRLYDASSIRNRPDIDFYSLTPDGRAALQIQGLSALGAGERVIPLGYVALQPRRLTLQLATVEGEIVNRHIYLRDRERQIVHDLQAESYSFDAQGGIRNDRFELLITDAALDVESLNGQNLRIHREGNRYVVTTSNGFPIERVRVFDLSGKLLYDKDGIHASSWQFTLEAPAQILLVKVRVKGFEHDWVKKTVHP
ncbi:MAG: hypothetical protein GXO27_00890, partial [Chlorobi bacterium]|nr:hypothetical protein [Chlorobiota bacterium]